MRNKSDTSMEQEQDAKKKKIGCPTLKEHYMKDLLESISTTDDDDDDDDVERA